MLPQFSTSPKQPAHNIQYKNQAEELKIDGPTLKHLKKHKYPHPYGRDWVTHIYEANLWMANGYTNSQFHYDKENIILCLYRGEKEFIMADTRTEHENVFWARGQRYKGDEDDLLNRG